jgi:hypothetical protein
MDPRVAECGARVSVLQEDRKRFPYRTFGEPAGSVDEGNKLTHVRLSETRELGEKPRSIAEISYGPHCSNPSRGVFNDATREDRRGNLGIRPVARHHDLIGPRVLLGGVMVYEESGTGETTNAPIENNRRARGGQGPCLERGFTPV